ncbi:MAG: transporter substrate-binding domain-containing protein [Myxococcota bacterium]|nr:transporter substrate-binding domain-containing protein [Myxococcota bacterium]
MRRLIVVLTVLVGGCAEERPFGVLADVLSRGELRVSTDAAYPPQSELIDGEWYGFDIDVARAIGDHLGVQVTFVTPPFDDVIAGGWQEAWDLSVGSVTITNQRLSVLNFSTPYYYVPAYFGAIAGSGLTSSAQLAGRTICVASGTTYEDYLSGRLSLSASSIYEAPPPAMGLIIMDTDTDCIAALLETPSVAQVMMSSQTTIDDAGAGIARFERASFAEQLAVATDRGPTVDDEDLLDAVNGALADMRASGELTDLSVRNYGRDLTQAPND